MRRLAASSSAPIAAADRGFRGGRHSTSYERTARTLPYRAAPGHARLDHPPDPALGTAARLRHRADDPGVVTRRTPGGHRLALPCPAPARASGMDRRRVEQIREQATGAGLHLDREGTQAAGTGAIAMGAAESRDRGDSPPPGRERALSPRDDEIQEEIAAHLRMAIADKMARGASREEAERTARAEFGNVTHVAEVTREMRGGLWLERLGQDLRYGWRALRRTPAFTLVAVLT